MVIGNGHLTLLSDIIGIRILSNLSDLDSLISSKKHTELDGLSMWDGS